jgi:hypothetical protein
MRMHDYMSSFPLIIISIKALHSASQVMYFCTVLVSFSSYVFQYTYSVLACNSHKLIDGLSAMLRLSYRAI